MQLISSCLKIQFSILAFCKLIAKNNTWANVTLIGKQIFGGAINVLVIYLCSHIAFYRYINEAFRLLISFFHAQFFSSLTIFAKPYSSHTLSFNRFVFSLVDICQWILPFLHPALVFNAAKGNLRHCHVHHATQKTSRTFHASLSP